MPFKPATDWVEAFPEVPAASLHTLPPARKRTPPDIASRAEDRQEPLVRRAPDEVIPTPDHPVTEEAGGNSDPGLTENPGLGDDGDYAVGYKKPPLHSRFQQGRSGNPNGRPRKAKSLNTIVRETLGVKIAVHTAKGTKKISRIEAVLQKTLEQAMKGNPRAQAELIKLWRSAVPDEAVSETAHREEDLTAADIAMLEAFGAQLRQHEGGAP